jgi:hypothetical protein
MNCIHSIHVLLYVNYVCPKQFHSLVIVYELHVVKTTPVTCHSVLITYIQKQFHSNVILCEMHGPKTTPLTCFPSRFSTCNETRIECKGGGGPISAEDYLSLTSCSVSSTCQTVISSPRTQIARHCKDWVRG